MVGLRSRKTKNKAWPHKLMISRQEGRQSVAICLRRSFWNKGETAMWWSRKKRKTQNKLGCLHDKNTGKVKLVLSEGTPLKIVQSWDEVCELSLNYHLAVVLGVCAWSHFSQIIIKDIVNEFSWFSDLSIAVSVFCLDDIDQAKQVCPQYFESHTVNAEPLVLVVRKGILKASRGGKISKQELQQLLIAAQRS
jgi:hypothetical protein